LRPGIALSATLRRRLPIEIAIAAEPIRSSEASAADFSAARHDTAAAERHAEASY